MLVGQMSELLDQPSYLAFYNVIIFLDLTFKVILISLFRHITYQTYQDVEK